MKHILVIDDVKTNLICTSEVLKEKYKVSTAVSGKMALEVLKTTKLDMILLDINMPDMDGYELLEYLKKSEDYYDIPIAFLTAETDLQSEVKGLQMGAMDFIRKPYSPEILLSRVAKVLQMDETKRELESFANKDSLTELWNRRYMEEYVEKDSNVQDSAGVFMLLDMDNFKQINDNYGHLMGDKVLVAFAKTLRESVGPETSVCRIGGDEFVVFIKGCRDEDQICLTARKVLASVEYKINKLLNFDENLKISVSIGIALKPADGRDFSTLYNSADKALYFVKQNGKRGFHFYHKENDNDTKAIRDENNLIDLQHIKMLIQETDVSGAYKVEYNGFKRIYRFVSRCVERSKQDAQIVLFNVFGDQKAMSDQEAVFKLEVTMKELEEAISDSLRRGDVAAKFSATQIVAILMDTHLENGRKVADRILEMVKRKQIYPEYEIDFDIQPVKSWRENANDLNEMKQEMI